MHKTLIRLDFYTGDVLSHSDTWKFKLTVANYTMKGKNVPISLHICKDMSHVTFYNYVSIYILHVCIFTH